MLPLDNVLESVLKLFRQLRHYRIDRYRLVLLVVRLSLMMGMSMRLSVLLQLLVTVKLWHYAMSLKETMVVLVSWDRVKSWMLLVHELPDSIR